MERRGFFKAILAGAATAALAPVLRVAEPYCYEVPEEIGYEYTQDELKAYQFMVSQLSYGGERRVFQRHYEPVRWDGLMSEVT